MKKTKLLRALSLACAAMLSAAALAACSAPASGPANAAGTKPAKIVIAYLPNEADEKVAEFRKGFGEDLSKALSIPVEEFLSADYNATVEAMRTGKADMALFGPLTFTQAAERAKAEPLAVIAKNADKSLSVYQSLLIVKADSTINTIQDIKGHTMAFVDPNSTSGNLVPSAEILKAFPNEKMTIDDLHTNGKFFSAVSFSGKHQAGLQAVIKGDVEVAPIASNTFSGGERLRQNLAHAMVKEPRLLLQDEPTASLDNSSKEVVRSLLLQMKSRGTSMVGIFHDVEFMDGVCVEVFRLGVG